MKRKLLIAGSAVLGLAILGFIGLYIWIDIDVKKNIKTAQERYPGNAEDALIAYLIDTTNTAQDRTSVAIWTLGQIQSEKAIPVLEDLYKNDPKGETCYHRHDSVLCQYEIYKALITIRSNWWPQHSRLNR